VTGCTQLSDAAFAPLAGIRVLIRG
jgi:hypothetical protein